MDIKENGHAPVEGSSPGIRQSNGEASSKGLNNENSQEQFFKTCPFNGADITAILQQQQQQPFHRSRIEKKHLLISAIQQSSIEMTRKNILQTLGKLGAEVDSDWPFETVMETGLEQLPNFWRKRDSNSEIALQGLLTILEYCLQHCYDSTDYFEKLVNALGYNTVQFWKAAIPHIFESDMAHGTKYRDAILFSMTLYDVNTGRGRIRELYAAVPGLRKSLLGFHAKRFQEQYHHLQRRRASASKGSSLRSSTDSLNGGSTAALAALAMPSSEPTNHINGGRVGESTPVAFGTGEEHLTLNGSEIEDEEMQMPRKKRSMSIGSGSNTSDFHLITMDETSYATGGLANTHFQQRVINVSNAPPVSLKRDEKSGEWDIKQGSGGLVSCVDPVMSVNPENMWLANLGMNLRKDSASQLKSNELLTIPDDVAPTTNTLGLPLMRQTLADVLFHVIADDDLKEENESDARKIVREEMSLLGVLNNYNRGNYKLNPVIVQEQDYNVYYGGISNGLLWPTLHNLPEYIAEEYNDPVTLREHWCSYVRVNYQFAIDAVRNSRPQDFVWIHDYHLMLTGMIMHSLDENLEIGFFLHIPFLPPDNFFTKYRICAFPILRGLLRFTKIGGGDRLVDYLKVGFQTHRDRAKFIELVSQYLPTAKIVNEANLDIFVVTYHGWSCSLGVFPVSIKNEDFLKIAKAPETISKSQEIRKKILGENPSPDARFFFSVERFDYTKGIKEKLLAYKRFLEKYPSRVGKDVLYQVAVTNRRSVDTYRVYQDECIELAEAINAEYQDEEAHPGWKPLIFQCEGLQRPSLIAHYLAMDIGVVTPKKDGMNLVAKEMLVCNSSAGLILSTGAGSEIQFTMAGLHPDDGDFTYHRVEDVYDVERYADAFYAAATEPEESRISHGRRLNEFIIANDIERWSAAFLDPGWSHVVIRQSEVKTLEDFNKLMQKSRDVRRQIVERVLKGIAIKSHFSISLSNARESLVVSCQPGTTILRLKGQRETLEECGNGHQATFDIKTEIEEFDKDLGFLDFIQNENVDNVEQFISTLKTFHPISAEKFTEEAMAVIDLFADADHFSYFFTDRDGTLKSYSCSYSASVQPAYSGVIQAQFARRCAQTCAIITTAPLMKIGILDVSTIPEGYYYYGASVGRDWFIDPANKFKDQSIPEPDLDLLDKVFDAISDLLEEPEFRHFTWVGSGLQKHYGHVTVAHQDAFGSVPTREVEAIDRKIREIVQDIDPTEQILSTLFTDTDIKVFIKSESGGIFDKGHGLKLLVEHLKCDLKQGPILVCGDSETDMPMLRYCLEANSEGVYTVWVTINEQLRRQVKELCEQYGNHNFVFVSCPEVLLGGMAQATIREISIGRPRYSRDSE